MSVSTSVTTMPPALTAAAAGPPRSLWSDARRRLARNRAAVASAGLLAFVVLACFAAPWWQGLADPTAQDLRLGAALPTVAHPFGTDELGRDLLARLLYGARVSLFIACTAVFLIAIVGTVMGIVAGYKSGWVDTVIGRFTDLLLAFPLILMLIALSPVVTQRLTAVGLSNENARIVYLIIVFAFFGWPYLARLIRGQVLSLREREFVEAAVANGAPTRRILFTEILPNLWAPIIVYVTISLPTLIAAEAALAYLGVGVIEPTPSWGKMLADSVRYFAVVPTYLFIPGTALFIVVYAFNVFGDAVRDALDPRTGRNLR